MQFQLATLRDGDDSTFAAVVVGDRAIRLADVKSAAAHLGPTLRSRGDDICDLFVHWDHDFPILQRTTTRFGSDARLIASMPLQQLEPCAPFVPRQTFCAVNNYRSHLIRNERNASGGLELSAGEQQAQEERMLAQRLEGAPYMCFKLPSTIAGPNDELSIPSGATRVDWELELGVIIARACRKVSRAQAMDYVAGYVIANDITARDAVFRKDVPKLGADWLQSKNAPGFLPFGPFVVPAAYVDDPYALRLTLKLNGDVMQDEWVADMLFDVASQIEYASRHAALLPGDVICTGTPAGCGIHVGRFLTPGDLIEATITGLGTQRTRVVQDAAEERT